VYNILGLGFYGESQITGTVGEYYFEPEEEIFTEEQQDLTEEGVIGSGNINSPNSRYVVVASSNLNSAGLVKNYNADTLYEETIYLQSNEDKNNIMTSLSNILKQVISFISQKLKAIFAI
jgi:subtilisin-like proprotein convertase family protein